MTLHQIEEPAIPRFKFMMGGPYLSTFLGHGVTGEGLEMDLYHVENLETKDHDYIWWVGEFDCGFRQIQEINHDITLQKLAYNLAKERGIL